MRKNFFFPSFLAVFRKEISHLLHSPTVLVFAVLFPIIESVMLGYVLDINVRSIKTVVFDLAHTQDSKRLIERFVSTNDFEITEFVSSDRELYDYLISGKAKVAIKIPSDYSKQIVNDKTASVLVLVDGADIRATTEVVNVSNLIALQESTQFAMQRISPSLAFSPVAASTVVLYNPATRSADFFLPGLMVFDMPSVTILLLALSFATERERGTMDQLLMAPLNIAGFLIGKSLPYGIVCLFILSGHLLGAHFIYGVNIHGNPITLLLLSIPYLLTSLSIGICVAAFSYSQIDAMNLGVLARVIPTLYLSGYFFPIEGMPPIFQSITKFVPDRYFMEITRGVILRGAGFSDLLWQAFVLSLMALFLFTLGVFSFRRKL